MFVQSDVSVMQPASKLWGFSKPGNFRQLGQRRHAANTTATAMSPSWVRLSAKLSIPASFASVAASPLSFNSVAPGLPTYFYRGPQPTHGVWTQNLDGSLLGGEPCGQAFCEVSRRARVLVVPRG